MKSMKKVMSIVLVALMLLSMSGLGLSASADEFTEGVEDIFRDYYESTYDEELIYTDMYGDTDQDGTLTVKDATLIQKHLAGLTEIDEYVIFFADVDADGDVTIKDATAIQKAVAGITNGLPIEPVYTYDFAEDSLDVTVLSFTTAYVDFELDEDAVCELTLDCEDPLAAWFVIDGLYYDISSTVKTYLAAGEHQIVIEWYGEDTLEGTLTITATPYEAPTFDPADAVEVDGTPIEVKAGAGAQLFKVNGTSEDDSVLIYTEGDNPKLSAQVFDADMNYVEVGNISYIDYSNLSGICYLPASESDYYYIYITQAEGGTDYTLYCGSMIEMIIVNAVELELDKAETVPTEYAEAEEDGYIYAYSAVSGIYKFIPDTDGYYKFSLTTETMGTVYYIISDEAVIDGDDSALMYMNYFDSYDTIDVYDSEYLEAGKSYYIILFGALYDDVTMTITASASNEDEYNYIHGLDTTPDENVPTEYEEIAVGETKDVTFATADEVKWFKFTAEEDANIVVYSEGSEDAYLLVYDAEGNMIGGSDDSGNISFDFTAIGDVVAGCEYYFSVGSYSNEGDTFTITVVNESDYIPYDVAV